MRMLKTFAVAVALSAVLATSAAAQPAPPALSPFASASEQQAAMRAGTLTSEACQTSSVA